MDHYVSAHTYGRYKVKLKIASLCRNPPQETVTDSTLVSLLNADTSLLSEDGSTDWKNSSVFRLGDCNALTLTLAKSNTALQGYMDVSKSNNSIIGQLFSQKLG